MQEVAGDSVFSRAGLRFIPVVHEGNQSRSDEEVAAMHTTFLTVP